MRSGAAWPASHPGFAAPPTWDAAPACCCHGSPQPRRGSTGSTARRRCSAPPPRATGLPVALLRQNLRSLSLPEPVDLITCTFDTLNYLLSERELADALGGFRRNLAASGLLLIDMITGAAWAGAPQRTAERLRRRGFAAVWRTWTEPSRRVSVAELRFRSAAPQPGPWHREVRVQRGYPLEIVRRLVREARFTIRECRDLDTDRPATEASNWVHVAATR